MTTRQRKYKRAHDTLLEEYKKLIEEVLPSAQKANGPRFQFKETHIASRHYTKYLIDYYNEGGCLAEMARKLNVEVCQLENRVFFDHLEVSKIKPVRRSDWQVNKEETYEAAMRIKSFKNDTAANYHDAIRREYENGYSLTGISKILGMSSNFPLYYGLQRSLIREEERLKWERVLHKKLPNSRKKKEKKF